MPSKRWLAKSRQRLNSAAGGGLPITVVQPRNCGVEQQAVIAILTRALYDYLSKDVNYEHVKLTIPKAQVPIVYRNHTYDVAVKYRRRVLLIDVTSVDVGYWKRAREAESGEAQEQTL